MLVAVDSEGKRYLATERDVVHKERFYICQECKQNIFLRIYTDRLSHFAHYTDGKECTGPWEPDSELHMTMKKDVYDYFKSFPWVQTIEIEYPIDIGKERLISDIFITTQNGENINIECQATVYDMYHMLKRVEKFSSVGIHTLYIFEIDNFGNKILNWNEDVYISSTINVNKDTDKDIKDAGSLYIHRFYLYNSDLTLREKYSNIMFSVDRVYGRDPYPMISSVYINSTKFDEYRLGTIDNKYSIMMDTAPYKKDKIEEAQKLFEEELKRKEEQRKVREQEIKKQEEERKKFDDDLKKKREEMLRLAKERDSEKNINKGDTTWALYMDVPGTDKPVLLSPLRWKGSDQVSNLITMAKFFETIDVRRADFTKMLLYLSVCGSGKCLDGDSLILTNKGIIRIEDIVKEDILKQRTIEESFSDDISKNSNNSYIGNAIKSFNLNNVRLEDDIISNVFDMGESEIIDIVTKSGFDIKCTPTHKLIIIDDNCDLIFREAKDISVGDNVAIVRGTEIYGDDSDLFSFYQSDFYKKHKSDARCVIIPDKMNEDLAELLGYIISEGNIYEATIKVTNDEEIIRNRVRSIISMFGLCSYEKFDNKRYICDTIETTSVIFCDFLRYIGYIDGSKNKEVPWPILRSSKKVQIAFLKALFSGDGYIGNENTNYIEYYTISKKLAEQLHVMLLNMGIFSSLKEKDAICRTEGYKKHCGICYRVSIYGKNDIMKYISMIGFVQDYKKSRCAELLDRLESKDFSYQSRTVRCSHIRLKRIYEEFKKLGKQGNIIKAWKENVSLCNKTIEVTRHKKLSAMAAIIDRGFKGGNITEWLDGSYSASKRQILKLLKTMKECYYMEDFRYLYNIAMSNIEFDTVEKIESGKGHVYDLTIRDNHSYVGNGFINHNSATLLHEIRAMGRGIIVTPFKNLQRQYSEDYFKGNKFVLKRDGKKLSVTVIVGRNNFKCIWLEEQYQLQRKIIDMSEKPENVGQYAPVDDDILNTYRYDQSCANRRLPCTRPLRYIGKGRRESRMSVGPKCQYWIPTPMPKDIIDSWAKASVTGDDIEENFDDSSEHDFEDSPDNEDVIKKPTINTRLDDIKEKVHCSNIEYYNSVGWGEVGVFIRDVGPNIHPVCPYYEQFYSYARSDAIVMNSAKWNLETQMGRKPQVDIEIMDEGDYWLDSLTTTIEITRSSIDKIITGDSNIKKLKSDALAMFDMSFKHIKARLYEQSKAKAADINIIDAANYREVFQAMLTLFREYAQETDDDERIEQKLVNLDMILRYSDRASISIKQGAREETKILKIYIPYPDLLLSELLRSSSKNIIITSGTLHEKSVLNNLFGINANNYIVSMLTGRKDQPGKLKCVKPREGLPVVNYTSWQSDQFKVYYCKVLTYIIDNIKLMVDRSTNKPGEGKIIILTPSKKYANCIINRPDVHVDFAKGNPDDENVKINTTLSDYVDNVLEDVKKIKGEDINIDGDVLRTNKQIIVSTRMIRGTDLRDNKCRGLIILKWPMSDISDGYNQALKKRFGDNTFWDIMHDKAARDAVQMVSRGLRHDLDWEYFSSPDQTAFENVIKLFST